MVSMVLLSVFTQQKKLVLITNLRNEIGEAGFHLKNLHKTQR